MLTLALIGIVALAWMLRSVPHWLAPAGAGVDHWYWKTYVETYRRTRTFPPHLPQYVLEEGQWYPPLFGVLLAHLPSTVLDRWSQQVAVLIDLGRLALLLGIAAWQSGGNDAVLIVAGLVYATTPIQISYNSQLNPRGLAAMMLDGLLMALLSVLVQGGQWWVWLIVVALGGLILLTHKMTTQLLLVLVVGTAALYRRPELLLLVPACVAAALILSRGFYWKVLQAHWDIVQFWHRNWRWIGADPIRESPIYGDGSYERPQKLHKTGLRGVLWHAFILLGFNPAAWIACLLVYERIFVPSALLIYPTPFLVWLLLACLWAVLTSIAVPLKRFGAGYLYVYNTSLLASLILGLTYAYTRSPVLSTLVVGGAIGLNLFGVALYYRQFLHNRRARVDEGLDRMLNRLAECDRGVVMCLPANWYEVVAYRTGQPVLWGAHGYGFRLIEPTWPRVLLPLDELMRRYEVRYLLTMEGMLTPEAEQHLPPATCVSDDTYRLYCFTDGSPTAPVPGLAGAAAGGGRARVVG
jgi:hypothetical protein